MRVENTFKIMGMSEREIDRHPFEVYTKHGFDSRWSNERLAAAVAVERRGSVQGPHGILSLRECIEYESRHAHINQLPNAVSF